MMARASNKKARQNKARQKTRIDTILRYIYLSSTVLYLYGTVHILYTLRQYELGKIAARWYKAELILPASSNLCYSTFKPTRGIHYHTLRKTSLYPVHYCKRPIAFALLTSTTYTTTNVVNDNDQKRTNVPLQAPAQITLVVYSCRIWWHTLALQDQRSRHSKRRCWLQSPSFCRPVQSRGSHCILAATRMPRRWWRLLWCDPSASCCLFGSDCGNQSSFRMEY